MKSRVNNPKAESGKRRPAPNIDNGIVPPRRVQDAKRRPREYLTVKEVARLMQDARALQHYLGHKNIQHTVRYTELSPEQFKSFWGD